MGIKIICVTNLDEFRSKSWPKELACQPTVGDRIRARCGSELFKVSHIHGM